MDSVDVDSFRLSSNLESDLNSFELRLVEWIDLAEPELIDPVPKS